jgi:hypothetical protein
VWHARPFAQIASVSVYSVREQVPGQPSPGPSLLRQYNLGYTQNAPWNTVSYLSTITLIGSDGSSSRNLRQFTYTPDAPNDGDGNPVVWNTFQPSSTPWGPWATWNNGGSSSSTTSFPYAPPVPATFVDVNGDARADLVYGPISLWPGAAYRATSAPILGPSCCAPWWNLIDLFGSNGEPTTTSQVVPALFLPPPGDGLVANEVDLSPESDFLVYGPFSNTTSGIEWMWLNVQANQYELYNFPSVEPNAAIEAQGGYGYLPTSAPHDPSDGIPAGAWYGSNAFDLDGDGLVDVPLYWQSSNHDVRWSSVTIQKRDGAIVPFAWQIGTGANYPALVQPNTLNSLGSSDTVTEIADVSGDGLPDGLVLYKQGDGPIYVHVFLNGPSQTWATTARSWHRPSAATP